MRWAICPSTARKPTCSSSSSATATNEAPPSSPPTRASGTGRSCSAIRSSPPRSSTGCSTTVGWSTSRATATGSESTLCQRTNLTPRRLHRRQQPKPLTEREWYTFRFPKMVQFSFPLTGDEDLSKSDGIKAKEEAG